MSITRAPAVTVAPTTRAQTPGTLDGLRRVAAKKSNAPTSIVSTATTIDTSILWRAGSILKRRPEWRRKSATSATTMATLIYLHAGGIGTGLFVSARSSFDQRGADVAASHHFLQNPNRKSADDISCYRFQTTRCCNPSRRFGPGAEASNSSDVQTSVRRSSSG